MDYEFDSAHVAVIAKILDRNALDAEDPMDVWSKLSSDPDYAHLDPALRLELDFLFTLELEEDFSSAGVVRLVEPNIRATAARALASTSDAAWSLRTALLSQLKGEMMRSHVADLILTGRRDTTPAHAELTVNSYIACAVDGTGDAHQRAVSLARANTIARQRRMTSEGRIRSEALTLARQMIQSDDAHAALTLLAALAAPARDGATTAAERAEIRRILLGLVADTLTFIDEVVRILLLAADSDADRAVAARLHIEWYLNRARADSSGIRTMHFAYEAMGLAERYEQLDLRDEAAVVLQGIGDDIELQSVVSEARISRNHHRAHLCRFRRARDWRMAYRVFLAGRSPSGDHAKNLAEAPGASGGILALVNRVSLGPHNLPARTGGDPVDEQLQRIEKLTLGVNAGNLALELDYIHARFEGPTREEFADWISASFGCDKALTVQFAEAQARHWASDYSGASRISLPLIEAAARGLLLTLDEPLYRAERGDSPGRFPAMDFYAQSLETNGMDIDWVRALRATLLSDGLNLRNLYAHGFKFEFTESESALLLRLVGLLCALAGAIDRSELSRPTAAPQRGLRRRLGWVWV